MRSFIPILRLVLSLLLISAASVSLTVADAQTKASTGDADKARGDSANAEPSGGQKDEKSAKGDKFPPVKSQIIQQAPEVELLNNGDIDPEGDCKDDVETFCANVRPGSSHLAECLQNRIEDEEDGTSELSGRVSKQCKAAVTDYKIMLATNINYDTTMAKACKKDAEEKCSDLKDITNDGKIITCLRERKPDLTAKCREHIIRAQLAAAKDYRIDAYVHDSCKMDAYKFCKDVEAGSGRVNACLRDHRDEVQPDCRVALFHMDIENSDDIRLNTILFRACLNDKRRFCPDVFPGNGRAADCLEDHMDKPTFSDECKAALEDRIEMMSRDYRLDPAIRNNCKGDIRRLCAGPAESLQGTMDTKGTVMECLKRERDNVRGTACKAAVARAIERASRNVRFATGIAAACYNDRQTFCKSIKPGDARVIRCLEEARAQLSSECRSSMFDHEVMISESIDFNHPLKVACLDEVEDFCDGIPAGDARVIRCLQDGNRKSYSRKCVQELAAVEKKMGQDFRFNRRLEKACATDWRNLCQNACAEEELRPCGGKVLQCLVDKQDELTKRDCKKEVAYFVKMEVSNFDNDVILAEACRDDVERFCSEIAPGDGRVHECLRARRSKLSESCAREELKLEIQESQNFDLRVNLKKVCVKERSIFCKDVSTGSARVFRCLAHNLAKADFGDRCRQEIKAKLMRRQQNWKLDVSLRTECKGDAAAFCADVDHDADKAEVMRCLVTNHANLTDSCAHEVSRAAYMALNVYQEDGPITKVCADDADVCADILTDRVAARPGAVLGCLERMQKGAARNNTRAAKHKLAPDCETLLAVAVPPDEQQEFESNLKAIASINVKDSLATVGMWDHRKGVTITGYTALACFSALCTSVAMGLMHLYRRWRGIRDDGYVQVIKRGDL